MYIKIVVLVITLLVLAQAQSNEDNSLNNMNLTKIVLTDTLEEIVFTLNNYVTSFIEFIINIQKSISAFTHQVQVNGKPFTNITAFKAYLYNLDLSPNTSCLLIENMASADLLRTTELKIATCLNNVNPLTEEVITLYSNLLLQVISTIENSVETINNCLQNSHNLLMKLPVCLASNIYVFRTKFEYFELQFTDAISTSIKHIGGVTNATTLCLNGVVTNSFKKAVGIIHDFTNCSYNS